MAKRLLGASILALVLFFSMSGEVLAQGTGTIAGTIIDSTSGKVLPGVNVAIEGTQQGAASDAEGRFEISGIQPGTYDLEASFIGYENQLKRGVPVRAGDTTTVDFRLTRGQMGLDEVVVVGYGTQERQDVTGSISSVDVADQIETSTYSNVQQLFQGQVPGLRAGIATGIDGGTSLQVRGTTSLGAGTEPLIVVDGAPYYGNLNSLNPNAIKSIDVLKGASAAAAYGSSAANGVIEVRTKKGGETGAPTVSFRTDLQTSTPGQVVKPMTADEYVRYRAAYLRTLNPDQAEQYTPPNGNLRNKEFLGRLNLEANEVQNYMDGNTIDWWDQVNRDMPLRQLYNLSVSGSPENFSYHSAINYVMSEGQRVGDEFETFRARLNLSTDPTDWLTFGINSRYTHRDISALPASLGEAYDVSPLGDKYAEDGSLTLYPHNDQLAHNPFQYTAVSGRKEEAITQNLNGTIFAEVDLPYGFQHRVSWNSNFQTFRSLSYEPPIRFLGGSQPQASRSRNQDHRWHFINRLTWDQTLGEIHDLEATLLYQVERRQRRTSDAENEGGLALEVLGFGRVQGGGNPQVSSYDLVSSGTAAMARLHYGLMDRYLITGTFRRDGYSAFGTENPYAYFPSVSAGWRISEEPFLDVDAVNNLKLRLSWGRNGNRDIGVYSALQQLSTGKYVADGAPVTRIYANNLPNRSLQWEETTQYNAGVDFGLFGGRLSGTVDAYYSITENLILDRQLPDVTSFPSITTNLGRVDNRGMEVSLSSVNLSTETASWESTLNFSLNRNEIVELYGTGEDDLQNEWFLGKSLHRIWDYERQGTYGPDEAEEAAIYNQQPGDFRLRDVNGDSTLTPLEDKTFQGYTTPRYLVSLQNRFTYGNFTLSAFLNSRIGQYRSHNAHILTGFQYGRHNVADYPYWTRENPTDEWPRLGTNTSTDFTYWEKATFVRLQNLSLSYRLPTSLSERIAAGNIEVYFNARNVAVLTPFDGNDPETGSRITPRLYSLGVNMTF